MKKILSVFDLWGNLYKHRPFAILSALCTFALSSSLHRFVFSLVPFVAKHYCTV